jgi:hypothetical protein
MKVCKEGCTSVRLTAMTAVLIKIHVFRQRVTDLSEESLLSPTSGSDSPVAKPRGIMSDNTSVFDYSTAWTSISRTVESSVVSYVSSLVLTLQISALCSRCVFICFVQFSHSTYSLCNRDVMSSVKEELKCLYVRFNFSLPRSWSSRRLVRVLRLLLWADGDVTRISCFPRQMTRVASS